MRSFTVIVTGVGSTTGMSVIKALRGQSEFAVRIVGTDIHRRNEIAGASFCDAFHTVPRADDAGYVDAMQRVCQSESADIIIPIVDPELLVLAENRGRLESCGLKIAVSDARTVGICNDKFETFKFMRSHEIPTPDTSLANEVNDPRSLRYPVFVKPRNGVSSIDAFRVDSAEEFVQARSRIANLVVQDNLAGDEYTIDVMCDFSGRPFSAVPRRRIETRAGISYKGRTVIDDSLSAWGARIAKAVGIRGPANIQCKVSNGIPSFFEINPRFSGSLPLTVAAGVNAPLWILKLIAGETAPTDFLPFREVSMTRYWAEVFHPVVA